MTSLRATVPESSQYHQEESSITDPTRRTHFLGHENVSLTSDSLYPPPTPSKPSLLDTIAQALHSADRPLESLQLDTLDYLAHIASRASPLPPVPLSRHRHSTTSASAAEISSLLVASSAAITPEVSAFADSQLAHSASADQSTLPADSKRTNAIARLRGSSECQLPRLASYELLCDLRTLSSSGITDYLPHLS